MPAPVSKHIGHLDDLDSLRLARLLKIKSCLVGIEMSCILDGQGSIQGKGSFCSTLQRSFFFSRNATLIFTKSQLYA
jgi:hypothetical protein